VYLLDTNVVSEVRRTKPHGAVVAWLASIPNSSLYLSAVTFGELQAGIENARSTDPDKAAEIETWTDRLMASAQIISPDASVFRLWAKLMQGQSDDLYEDALIAATAIRSELTVVTRNVRDFRRFDVPVLDPFATPR
jgi:predicted nucleic acid-binding protein